MPFAAGRAFAVEQTLASSRLSAGSTDLATASLLTVWSSLGEQPKDAFDVYKTVLHYDGGTAEAAKGFQAEAGLNTGFRVARATLGTHFSRIDGGGPARCAEFMIGGLQGQMPAADFDIRRDQIREEMIGVADLLGRE